MLPDRVSNPGPLTYESGTLPIALRGPANVMKSHTTNFCGVLDNHKKGKHPEVFFLVRS